MSQSKVSVGERRPTGDPEHLAREAWLAIVRIFRSREVADLVGETAKATGLPPRHFGALLSLPLDTEAGKSMRALAEECASTPSYMTTVVDALEADGLVRRHPDPEDRRVKQVRLTRDGLTAVSRAHERMSVPPEGIRALTPPELEALHDLLVKAAAPYPWP